MSDRNTSSAQKRFAMHWLWLLMTIYLLVSSLGLFGWIAPGWESIVLVLGFPLCLLCEGLWDVWRPGLKLESPWPICRWWRSRAFEREGPLAALPVGRTIVWLMTLAKLSVVAVMLGSSQIAFDTLLAPEAGGWLRLAFAVAAAGTLVLAVLAVWRFLLRRDAAPARVLPWLLVLVGSSAAFSVPCVLGTYGAMLERSQLVPGTGLMWSDPIFLAMGASPAVLACIASIGIVMRVKQIRYLESALAQEEPTERGLTETAEQLLRDALLDASARNESPRVETPPRG